MNDQLQRVAKNPINAGDDPLKRARIVLRVALQGVTLPYEVADQVTQRAASILAEYQRLDAEHFSNWRNKIMQEQEEPAPDVDEAPNGAN
jgi:hypothetical protein